MFVTDANSLHSRLHPGWQQPMGATTRIQRPIPHLIRNRRLVGPAAGFSADDNGTLLRDLGIGPCGGDWRLVVGSTFRSRYSLGPSRVGAAPLTRVR